MAFSPGRELDEVLAGLTRPSPSRATTAAGRVGTSPHAHTTTHTASSRHHAWERRGEGEVRDAPRSGAGHSPTERVTPHRHRHTHTPLSKRRRVTACEVQSAATPTDVGGSLQAVVPAEGVPPVGKALTTSPTQPAGGEHRSKGMVALCCLGVKV